MYDPITNSIIIDPDGLGFWRELIEKGQQLVKARKESIKERERRRAEEKILKQQSKASILPAGSNMAFTIGGALLIGWALFGGRGGGGYAPRRRYRRR